MDEDPSNEAYVLSLLEGYGASEAEVMDVEPAPISGDWRDKYIAWSCTSALPPASCSDACPSSRGASSSGIFTRAFAATMPHPAPS
jgi:hypothetical protein